MEYTLSIMGSISGPPGVRWILCVQLHLHILRSALQDFRIKLCVYAGHEELADLHDAINDSLFDVSTFVFGYLQQNLVRSVY